MSRTMLKYRRNKGLFEYKQSSDEEIILYKSTKKLQKKCAKTQLRSLFFPDNFSVGISKEMIEHGEVIRVYSFIAVPKTYVYFLQIFINVAENNILYSNGASEKNKPLSFLCSFCLFVYLNAETKFRHFEYKIFLKGLGFGFAADQSIKY